MHFCKNVYFFTNFIRSIQKKGSIFVNYFDSYLEDVNENIPEAVQALIILIVAFICATIVKNLVLKALDFLNFDRALEKGKIESNKRANLRDFISKLFYLITFVLFIPGIFEKLGLQTVSSPIVSMLDKLLIYLPNIIAAVVLLVLGLFTAKVVKELLVPIFKKLNIDEYLTKIGFENNGNITLSESFANIVYVLILIPIIIASLDALEIEAISRPATEMLNNVLVFLPKVAIATVILFVGKFIAELTMNLSEKILVSIGTDKLTENIFKEGTLKTDKDFSLSKVIAKVIKYIIIIFFLVEGLNILELAVLTHIGAQVIDYMPYAISAIIILGITILVSNFVENYLISEFPKGKLGALITKVVIIVIGCFITLYQLGIAKELVNAAFIIILGAFALSFAISFGIGGKEFATHMLGKLEKKIDNKKR